MKILAATYPNTPQSYDGNRYIGKYNVPIPIQLQPGVSATSPPARTYLPPKPIGSTTWSINGAPQQNSQGQWINTNTGQPYHGVYTSPTGQQQFFSNGSRVDSIADVGTQKPVFDVTKMVKNPTISGQVDTLANQNTATGAQLTKSFNDYLDEANRLNAQNKAQLSVDQAAVNPDATIARVNADTANTASQIQKTNDAYANAQSAIQGDVATNTRDYNAGLAANLVDLQARSAATDAALRANNANYQASQQGVQSDIAGENQAYAGTVADRLAKLSSDLDTQNSQYEQAAQAVADRAYAAAQKQIGLYHLTSGTPTSNSGALDNRYIRAYSDINVPLQAQLADRRYNQTNQLYSLGQGADQQNYNNLINQYAGVSALNSDIAGRNSSLEGYLSDLYGRNYNAANATDQSQYNANLGVDTSASALQSDLANRYNQASQFIGQNDAQTAQYIQTLRQQTAGMSREQAAQYLQQLVVPISVAQQVLSGQIGNTSALNNLDQNANYYTVSTPYDASRIPVSQTYGSQLPHRSYTGTNGAPALPTVATTAAPASSTSSNWVRGSDGNWYVPDSTAPTGYRMVYNSHRSTTPAKSGDGTFVYNGIKYNYAEPSSGSGQTDYGVMQ